MAPTGTVAREAPDDAGYVVPDRRLIESGIEQLVAENRARAARLEAVSQFHANRVAELDGRGKASGFFALTPLQATTLEFAPLFCVSEMNIQINLDITDGIKKWFPGVWRRCLEGRLDLGRAQLCWEQLSNLASEADMRAYAELVEEYVDRNDDPSSRIFPVNRVQMQRAVRRRCLRFPQRDEQDSYAEAFKRRRVSVRTDENGMASLWASMALHSAQAADYRLTLIAKKLSRTEGEVRTLAQLRADALVDLLLGRLAVGATDAGSALDGMIGGSDPAVTLLREDAVGRYARAVINVTVPIGTLMGLGDEPGVLAGGASVPPDLVRRISAEPGSTWYRLLTDPRGRFLELSTNSYVPTEPICRWSDARDRSCVWPGCSRPATVCEHDHRKPAPEGPTCTCNLQPLCRHHHVFKHSEGVRVVRNGDGSYTWTTRFGSTFHTPAPAYPADSPRLCWPPEPQTGPPEPGEPLGDEPEPPTGPPEPGEPLAPG